MWSSITETRLTLLLELTEDTRVRRRGVKVEEEGKDVDGMAKKLLARHH